MAEYHDVSEFYRIMDQGYADVDCPECGEDYRIEPDGAIDCAECGTKVESPLITQGLI